MLGIWHRIQWGVCVSSGKEDAACTCTPMVPQSVTAAKSNSSSTVSKLKSPEVSFSLSSSGPCQWKQSALDEIVVNLGHQFEQLQDHSGLSSDTKKKNCDNSSQEPKENSTSAAAAEDATTNPSIDALPVLNPDETLVELASCDNIMEWHEILNLVAREENEAQNEDIA